MRPSSARCPGFGKGPVGGRCPAAWSQAPGSGGPASASPRREGACHRGRLRHTPSPRGPRVESHRSARLNLPLVLKEFAFPDSIQVCFNPPKEELSLTNKRRLKMVEKNVLPGSWERTANPHCGSKNRRGQTSDGVWVCGRKAGPSSCPRDEALGRAGSGRRPPPPSPGAGPGDPRLLQGVSARARSWGVGDGAVGTFTP